MKLSFAQIHRAFEAYKLKDDEGWKKFRLIAYETWRKGSKTNRSIDSYFPIGAERYEMTEEELDEVWIKYGKLKRN